MPSPRLLPLLALALVSVPSRAADTEIPLFPRGDLSGWVEEQHFFFKEKHPGVRTWTYKDGVVACDGSHGNCGFLRFDRKLADFSLRLEFRITRGCNSGVCVRAVPYNGQPDETLPSHTGYEVQILDDAGQPASTTGSGSFYGVLAPRANAARPAGAWNTLDIIGRGPRLQVTLNGQVVQDVDQTAFPAIKDRPREGYLLLQNHGHDAEFRNLRLRVLAPTR